MEHDTGALALINDTKYSKQTQQEIHCTMLTVYLSIVLDLHDPLISETIILYLFIGL